VPLDESLVYYWTSLGMSAVAVAVFLWLLAPPRRRKVDPPGKSKEEDR